MKLIYYTAVAFEGNDVANMNDHIYKSDISTHATHKNFINADVV